MTDWKAGDWVVFDLRVGQIKEVRDGGGAEFSDGMFATSGGTLTERFRPLTLRNKSITETFDHYYTRLKEIDGEAGFNYPDISQYFWQLALNAIDAADSKSMYDKAINFVGEAKKYTPVIDGVPLFRRKWRVRA